MSDNPEQTNNLKPAPIEQNLSDDTKKEVRSALDDASSWIKQAHASTANIGNNESGRLPSQDPPRHRPKL